MPSRSAGFSLMELMMAILLMSILFLAVPAFRSWQTILNTNAAVRGVASELRLSRSEAVNRNHDVVVTFDTTNQAFSIYLDTDGDGPEISELKKTILLSSYAAGTLFGTAANIGITGETISSPLMFNNPTTPPMIIFKGNGEALHFGCLYVASSADLNQTRIDRNRAIRVYNTGSVMVYRYDAGQPTHPWAEFF